MKLTMFLFITVLAVSAFSEDKIRIMAVFGGVTKESTRLNVKKGDLLVLNDVLVGETDKSKIQIQWDQNKMLLNGKFKFKLAKISEKKEPSVINLIYGKLRASVSKDSKTNISKDFQVKTPTAVSGVRGTDFFVSFNDVLTESEVVCFESEISFQDTAKNKSVIVKQGQWGGFGTRFGELKEPIDLPKSVLQNFDKSMAFAK